MNKETTCRVVIVALLAATLCVQILILIRIPPRTVTWGDLYGPAAKQKNGEQRKAMMLQLPLVRVAGSVDVDVQNTVDVDVQNTPSVEIENTPVEVQIVR